jgi:hypothetical protein
MMPMRRVPLPVRFATAVALVLVLAGCTPGGQFDPTVLFANDAFDTKKKLQGDREPVFPNGVPGTETGVPPDLVKGYQPPPDQAANTAAAPDAAAQAAAKLKPKPKPKPQVARAPAQPQDHAFDQKASQPPTRISVGPAPKPATPAQQGAGSPQSVWPAPAAPAQQTVAPLESRWPASPQTTPPQQTAQPSQSIWPNSPAPGASSQ